MTKMTEHPNSFITELKKQPWAQGCVLEEPFWELLIDWLKEYMFPEFLSNIVKKVEEIIEINPDLSEPETLSLAAKHMVEFLGARLATVRIYDPLTEQLLSSGSYPFEEETRPSHVPLENSVAGLVVKTQKTYLVPNILNEPLYHDKQITERVGIFSLLAVPLGIPHFFPHERDTIGVIQIYFPHKDRAFTPLEIQAAELMARRLSFVIARKKILAMHKVNEKKEAIVRKIFLKLGASEGVKMKEVFNRVIPELADIINVQSCALFSVSEDREYALLEAGYPEHQGFHGIGKRFAVKSEPAFALVLRLQEYYDDSLYEMVTPSYILVMDPQKSRIVSENVKRFSTAYNINSILYMPLNVGEEITHFMTFDALDHRQRYTEGEIEIFLFLGRELMKAQRMERLDDILHDFKNPAIATAGFARRLKTLIEKDYPLEKDSSIYRYLDILVEETNRLQEMALSIYHVGKEKVIDLTQVLQHRFEINKEAIQEQLKQFVELREGPFQDNLFVHCYPLLLERILDNLLNNATNAIPPRGGFLAVRTFSEEKWACAEISNTGNLSEEERLRLLEGEGRGRGLYITHRIIRLLKGKIEISIDKNITTIVVRLPRHQT
ncbi:MAG: GAF domain-containing sensor histidine kinase [Desulfobacteraceae bacterium]|nr:MAG: GAF domain-containing sensor histidine kinase [Desulfobacteraceae bacterium]